MGSRSDKYVWSNEDITFGDVDSGKAVQSPIKLFEDEIAAKALIDDDLAKWEKFLLNRFGKSMRPFEVHDIPLYLYFYVQDHLPAVKAKTDIVDLFDTIWEAPPVKDKRSYGQQLQRNIKRLFDAKIDARRFEKNLQQVVDSEYREAWERGLRRANVTADVLVSPDPQILEDLIKEEQGHIRPLAERVAKLRSKEDATDSLAVIRRSAPAWVVRLEQIENRAYIIGSKRDKRGLNLKWVFDPIKDHCDDCKRLDGHIASPEAWEKAGIEPQSSRLSCFGTHCGCRFVSTSAPAMSRPIPF